MRVAFHAMSPKRPALYSLSEAAARCNAGISLVRYAKTMGHWTGAFKLSGRWFTDDAGIASLLKALAGMKKRGPGPRPGSKRK